MMFFIGGSLGAALLSSIVTIRAGASTAWNPFYDGPAVGYSDAFSVLGIGVVVVLALVAPLPFRVMVEMEKAKEAAVLPGTDKSWTPDCTIPWCPELNESSGGPASD